MVVYNGDRAWTGAPHRHGPLVGPPTAAGRALNRWRALELIDYHALVRGADLFGRPLPLKAAHPARPPEVEVC